MSSSNLPPSRRFAIVTRVRCQRGIAFAVARRLGRPGTRLVIQLSQLATDWR